MKTPQHKSASRCATRGYYKLAVEYSRLAEDPNLEVATLKNLATRLLEDDRSQEALSTYQRALTIIDDPHKQVAPFLSRRIYLGLASAYARLKQRQEAEPYLDLIRKRRFCGK